MKVCDMATHHACSLGGPCTGPREGAKKSRSRRVPAQWSRPTRPTTVVHQESEWRPAATSDVDSLLANASESAAAATVEAAVTVEESR